VEGRPDRHQHRDAARRTARSRIQAVLRSGAPRQERPVPDQVRRGGMTVIAFDGKTLAADKRMCQGGGMARTVTKIARTSSGELLAITGGLDVGRELEAWYLMGAKVVDFPAKAKDDIATLIVIKPNGEIWTWAAG